MQQLRMLDTLFAEFWVAGTSSQRSLLAIPIRADVFIIPEELNLYIDAIGICLLDDQNIEFSDYHPFITKQRHQSTKQRPQQIAESRESRHAVQR